jgi:hypothetical protein
MKAIDSLFSDGGRRIWAANHETALALFTDIYTDTFVIELHIAIIFGYDNFNTNNIKMFQAKVNFMLKQLNVY